jgi:TPR repeat protein
MWSRIIAYAVGLTLAVIGVEGCRAGGGTGAPPKPSGAGQFPPMAYEVCDFDSATDCASRCNDGHGRSCLRLSMMHLIGHKVDRSKAAARRAVERACRDDFQLGCIAASVFAGRGPLALERVDGWRDRCHRGDLPSCQTVVALLEAGWLAAPDQHRLLLHLRQRLCRAGDPAACWTIYSECRHELHRELASTDCDHYRSQARRWARVRCAKGTVLACRAQQSLEQDASEKRRLPGPRLSDCFSDTPLGFDLTLCASFMAHE